MQTRKMHGNLLEMKKQDHYGKKLFTNYEQRAHDIATLCNGKD